MKSYVSLTSSCVEIFYTLQPPRKRTREDLPRNQPERSTKAPFRSVEIQMTRRDDLVSATS